MHDTVKNILNTFMIVIIPLSMQLHSHTANEILCSERIVIFNQTEVSLPLKAPHTFEALRTAVG